MMQWPQMFNYLKKERKKKRNERNGENNTTMKQTLLGAEQSESNTFVFHVSKLVTNTILHDC